MDKAKAWHAMCVAVKHAETMYHQTDNSGFSDEVRDFIRGKYFGLKDAKEIMAPYFIR